jgi:hypothetical protein
MLAFTRMLLAITLSMLNYGSVQRDAPPEPVRTCEYWCSFTSHSGTATVRTTAQLKPGCTFSSRISSKIKPESEV